MYKGCEKLCYFSLLDFNWFCWLVLIDKYNYSYYEIY